MPMPFGPELTRLSVVVVLPRRRVPRVLRSTTASVTSTFTLSPATVTFSMVTLCMSS